MGNRLIYLDRLKVFMTILVVLHHTSIVYGGAGGWYYYEHHDDTVTNALLSTFTAVNQSFFMGLFFFISGYVTPASYDRHGGCGFLKARLFRFGIPMLFYMLVISPLLMFVSSGYKGTFVTYLKKEVLLHPLSGIVRFSVGPLWYLEALLLFFIGYAVYRRIAGGKRSGKPLALTPRLMAGYVVIVALANFIIRAACPVGTEVINLQLGYFPAYIGLFMAGIAAYRGKWLQQLSVDAARKWKRVAIALIVLLPVGMVLGGALKGDISAFMGGFSWQAAFYSVVDPLMGLAISYFLLVWFRERWNDAAGKLTAWLSANAYLVYIIHAFFVTYTAYSLRFLAWHPLAKFVLAGCISVAVTYIAASLIRRLPGVKRVV